MSRQTMTPNRNPKSRSTSDIILDVLIEDREPLNLYKLSKRCGLSHQRISYNLTKLIKKGLIIPLDTEDGTKYTVQQIHTDTKLIQNILDSVEPLIDTVHHNLNLEHAENTEEAIANNLALFVTKKANETNR